MQMVFQDPFSSLNPRMGIADIIGEPLLVNGMRSAEQRRARVAELLDMVQLPRAYRNRFPHAFSGGQRQRIGIARALALNPSLDRGGRAGLGARRLGAGADPQPDARPAGPARPHLSVRRARSQRGEARQRPRRRDVCRPHRGDRRHAGALPGAETSLHRGAALRGAEARPARPRRARDPGTRGGRSRQSAARLPFPSALPLRAGTLPRRNAAVAARSRTNRWVSCHRARELSLHGVR